MSKTIEIGDLRWCATGGVVREVRVTGLDGARFWVQDTGAPVVRGQYSQEWHQLHATREAAERAGDTAIEARVPSMGPGGG